MGRVIKKSIMTDYFQGYKVSKDLPTTVQTIAKHRPEGQEEGPMARIQKTPDSRTCGRQIQFLVRFEWIKARLILPPFDLL